VGLVDVSWPDGRLTGGYRSPNMEVRKGHEIGVGGEGRPVKCKKFVFVRDRSELVEVLDRLYAKRTAIPGPIARNDSDHLSNRKRQTIRASERDRFKISE
jgi:hypothetical protein